MADDPDASVASDEWVETIGVSNVITIKSDSEISEHDFTLLVISLYKNSPVLWDVKNKDYTNKYKRQNACQQITDALKVHKPYYTLGRFKSKINTIRTNFNRQTRKIREARANGVECHQTLWWYDALSFLLDRDDSKGSDECNKNAFLKSEPSTSSHASPTKKRKIKLPSIEDHDDSYISCTANFTLPEEQASSSEPYTSQSEVYTSTVQLETDFVTKGWSFKLNRLAPDQRLFAEKIINDVLFEGEMGSLTRNGVIFPGCENRADPLD